MASSGRDDGGVPIGATDDASQPTIPESTSHGHDTGQQPGTVCRWRTARYYDEECSRFFDCPSHVVERALSDIEQDGEEDDEEDQEQDDEGSEGYDSPHPNTVSPLSESGSDTEGEDEDDGHYSARSFSPGPQGLGGGEPERHRERPGLSAGNSTRGSGSSTSSEPPQTERSSGAPLYPVPGPIPGGSGSQATSRPLPFAGAPLAVPSRSARPAAERPFDSGSQLPRRPPEPLNPTFVPMPRGSGAAPGSHPAPIIERTPMTRVLRQSPTEAERPGGSEVLLPRWQPDSEVTYCPICSTQFSIFVRKHHCRKCGRVVCNACSPHRITIPHQYIVRPPGAPLITAARSPVSPLDSPGWYPGFGGGEKVRLCNPCVPDPNTAPPQQRGLSRPPGDLGPPADSPITNRWGLYFGGPPNNSQVRGRSVTMPQQPGILAPSRPTGLPFPLPPQHRILPGAPSAFLPPGPLSSQPGGRPLYPVMHQPYRSMLDIASDRPGPSAGPSSSSFSETNPFRAHQFQAQPPPPQIAEEDECPVCHRELPRRSLPNFEALREAHIDTCITANSSYRAQGATVGATPGAGGAGGASVSGEAPLPPIPSVRRLTGMFPYTATEKDCVDSAECSICLEEFEVGVAMARLECLCRFHKRCIGAWWERHPGRCPMHQHDGLGY